MIDRAANVSRRRLGRRTAGRIAVFSVSLALALAATLTHFQALNYGLTLNLEFASRATQAFLYAALFGNTAAALGVGVLAASAAAVRCGARVGRGVALAWTAGVLVFLVADLEVRHATGSGAIELLAFLADPGALDWAGAMSTWVPVATQTLGRVAAGLAIGGLLAYGVERLALAKPGLARLVLAAGVLALLLPVLAQRAARETLLLRYLHTATPWSWHLGLRPDATGGDLSARVQAIFDSHRAEPPVVLAPADPLALTKTPHLVLVVVESFRHDALTASTMPALSALAASGARLERHYAASNSSHTGLFALFYGETPFDYYGAIERGRTPALPVLLQEAGYRTHLISSARLGWRRMEHFLGAPFFAFRPVADDATALAETLVLLRERTPQFVVLYLMGTHFPYRYPEANAPFQPTLPEAALLEGGDRTRRPALLNRYRNSVYHLDRQLGSWLARPELAEALILVTGDHGESLFDDGTLTHASRLSEAQTRVPCVLAGPGVDGGRRVEAPTSHVDLLPTLLARLGAPSEALVHFEGHDALARPPHTRRFVALVDAKARAGPREEIAAVGREERFGLRIDRERGETLFLGALDHRGLPTWRTADAQSFLEWLQSPLAAAAFRGEPASAPPRGRTGGGIAH